MPSEKPFINTHTHIFTAGDVPPFLARGILPWPVYFLTHIPTILRIRRFYLKYIDHAWFKVKFFYQRFLTYLNTSWIKVIYNLLLYVLFLVSAVFVLDYFMDNFSFGPEIPLSVRTGIILITLILLPWSRKILQSLGGIFFTPLRLWKPGPFINFLKRYMLIVSYASYNDQKNTFAKLFKMYPDRSRFVVLTMDMAYMGAGKPTHDYIRQLSSLEKLTKETSRNRHYDKLIPFLCIDPRRFSDGKTHRDRAFFRHSLSPDGQIILEDSFVKDFLEGKNGQLPSFHGIKLYPALGYYPFDERLLPLWLYCQDKGLPITTHCIMGTIYFRGKLPMGSMDHPVFEQNGSALKLKGRNNANFQFNHTHPLNYLVLLDKELLSRHIGKNCSATTKTLFGYDEATGLVSRDLSNLKINLAHYGGEDQWALFLERDRQDIAQHINKNPFRGTRLVRENTKESPGTDHASWLWDKADWYTLISSLMLQYPNVYADISYTLHDEKIYPLLKQSLKNIKLRRKILFGTDFYVVRNHLSEKSILTQLYQYLDRSEIRWICYENPDNFLRKNKETQAP